MAQIIFGPNTAPTEPNLDLNFTELYNLINGTGQSAIKVIGAGNPAGAVGTTEVIVGASNIDFVDSARTANNRVVEFLWSGGSFTGRFLNDAYSAATNWVNVAGGQAGGISQVSFSGDILAWQNSAGVEHFRKDAAGNLLVGTTSTTPNAGVALLPGGLVAIGNTAGSSGASFAAFYRSGVLIGNIAQNGTTAVQYNTTSDARLKTNIADAPDAGAIIDAIKVRAFGWKNAPDEHVMHGFVAQELVTVAPQAVKVGDSGVDVEDAWAVDPSKLVALLIKEAQDSRREMQILRNRLAAAGIA
jgi:hypothetical protein